MMIVYFYRMGIYMFPLHYHNIYHDNLLVIQARSEAWYYHCDFILKLSVWYRIMLAKCTLKQIARVHFTHFFSPLCFSQKFFVLYRLLSQKHIWNFLIQFQFKHVLAQNFFQLSFQLAHASFLTLFQGPTPPQFSLAYST